MREPGSVLLVELTRLGDVLTASLAVDAIRMAYASADIHWIVRETYAGFLRIAFPSVTIHGVAESSTVRSFLQGLHIARSRSWDLSCSLGPGRLNGMMVLASSSKAIAGYLECSGSRTPFRRKNTLLYLKGRKKNRSVYGKEPLADRSLKVCEVLEIPVRQGGTSLVAQRIASHAAFSREGGEGKIPSVVIHPFAGWKYRTWMADRWVALVHALTVDNGCAVTILGQNSESADLDTYRSRVSMLPGATIVEVHDLVEAAAVIAGATLFIGCDSGPLHLAALLGIRSIGLYGPADPLLTQPARHSEAAFRPVYHHVDCSPCGQRRCVRPANPCMALIQIDEVLDAAHAMLGSSRLREVRPHG